ncbi:MBL fold metallo-hydrolase [Streptomyces sp. NPDC058045]|uniref:MBL fold metallo-hydrolase n=1 Tax=Streptomyces sp. NPDC058045 TaxID=3346311 RepID=UPI0036E70365
MREVSVVEVAAGVHLVDGGHTNWVVLAEGDQVTLVDTGYPGDRRKLLASLAALGHRPESVCAVLVTHAHSDHLGSARYLHARHGIPVLLHEAEVPHARREFLHQIAPGTVLRNLWRPRMLRWTVRVVRSGALADVRVAAARAFDHTAPLDLPGRPVPVPTPGHTLGHTAFHLPAAGVLISGDALVTGHALTPQPGPRLLPDLFHHDRSLTVAALDTLEPLPADVLLPGHGPVHRGPLREAVARARELAGGHPDGR